VELVPAFTLRRSPFASKNTGFHWLKTLALRIAQRPNLTEFQSGGAF
jgi:hypothetical protein